MSIYIGNDLGDRLEALEAENTLLKKYNESPHITSVKYSGGCSVHRGDNISTVGDSFSTVGG